MRNGQREGGQKHGELLSFWIPDIQLDRYNCQKTLESSPSLKIAKKLNMQIYLFYDINSQLSWGRLYLPFYSDILGRDRVRCMKYSGVCSDIISLVQTPTPSPQNTRSDRWNWIFVIVGIYFSEQVLYNKIKSGKFTYMNLFLEF